MLQQGEQPTAYSSDVRCGSVAMRQVPRQPAPSCTAATTLVLPASNHQQHSHPRHPSNSFPIVTSPAAKACTRPPACSSSEPSSPSPANEPRPRPVAEAQGERVPSAGAGRERRHAPGRNRHGRARRSSAPALQHLQAGSGRRWPPDLGQTGGGAVRHIRGDRRLAPIPARARADRPARRPRSRPGCRRSCGRKQHVVRPFQRECRPRLWPFARQMERQRLGQRHPGQQRPLRRLARRAARPQQRREEQVARGPRPWPAMGAATGGLPARQDGQPLPARRPRRQGGRGRRWKGGFRKPPASRHAIDAVIGPWWGRGQRPRSRKVQPDRISQASALALPSAAAMKGAGITKKKVVNRAPAAATTDIEAGRASNGASAGSK